MKHSLVRASAAIGAGIAGALLANPAPSSAHLNNGYWWAAGHTLQNGQSNNMVGLWQNIGYGQASCPGSPIDGIFGPKTVAQTKRMQNDLPLTPLPQTGVVDATTWAEIQFAQVDFGGGQIVDRLNPIELQPRFGIGQHTYYGGYENVYLSWVAHPNGGYMWKFQPVNTNTWLWADGSHSMGSYPNPLC